MGQRLHSQSLLSPPKADPPYQLRKKMTKHIQLKYGALQKEYESLEWENLALKKDIEDFEDQQRICQKRNKFMKLEVDMYEKIQSQVANLRMSVKELLKSQSDQSWK